MEERYKKIIDMDRPELPNFPRMSMSDRAAQFSAFSALKGFEEETRETGRQTETQAEVDDGLGDIIDKKIQVLIDLVDSNPEIELTYFVQDSSKDGGEYRYVSGTLKKIDPVERKLVFCSGVSVDVHSISNISSDVFDRLGL